MRGRVQSTVDSDLWLSDKSFKVTDSKLYVSYSMDVLNIVIIGIKAKATNCKNAFLQESSISTMSTYSVY